MGALVIASLRFLNASSHFAFHRRIPFCFFVRLVTGAAMFENPRINRRKNCRRPIKLRSYVKVFGRGLSRITATFSGLTRIPEEPMIIPRKSVSSDMKEYFEGVEFVFCQSRKDRVKMNQMILRCLAKHQQIVQINHNKIINTVPKYVIP